MGDIRIRHSAHINLVKNVDVQTSAFLIISVYSILQSAHRSKECLPYLLKSQHPHILNLGPPLNMAKEWFAPHVAYTMAKYGMSMCVLGMAEEFRDRGVGVNALWPQTAIATAAMEMLAGDESSTYSRKVDIMADAAYAILCRDPRLTTGNFFIDEKVVQEEGITDLKQYACYPENADNLMPDFFLELDPTTLKKWEDQLAKQGGTGKAAAGSSDFTELFKKIEGHLNAELVSKVNAAYVFNVAGNPDSVWHIDLKTGAGKCGKGAGSSPADATLSMKSADFVDLFAGKLNATGAFMAGKLKISGDLQKAMKLEKLMGNLKSKL